MNYVKQQYCLDHVLPKYHKKVKKKATVLDNSNENSIALYIAANKINLRYASSLTYSLYLTKNKFLNQSYKTGLLKTPININKFKVPNQVINHSITKPIITTNTLNSFIPGVYSGTYNILHIIRKSLKKLKYDNASLNIKVLNNNLYYTLFNLDNQQSNLCNETIYPLIPYKYCPFVISIDSEFVDCNNSQYHIFENQRINFPLSVGVKINHLNFLDVNNYKTYVFDTKDYNYLKHYVQNSFLNDSLELINYTSSNQYTLENTNVDTIIPINQNSVFKTAIHMQVIKNYYNINTNNPNIYYVPPKQFKAYPNKNVQILDIFYYYSNKDLKYFFSSLLYEYIEPHLNTTRFTSFDKASCISTFGILYKDSYLSIMFKIKLNDLSGLYNRGLDKLALCTNVSLNKDILKDFKTNMKEAVYKKPNEFVQYQYEDTASLFPIFCNFYNNILTLYKDLNISYFPTIFSDVSCHELKRTIGSITANLLEDYLNNLNPHLTRSLYDIRIKLKRTELDYKDVVLIKGIELGSAKFLSYHKGSSIEGAFCQGGRCSNEYDNVNCFTHTLDGDFTSCYGSTLRQQDYIFGAPCILNNPSGGFVMNLKTFIKTYKDDLEINKWYAVVSTKKDNKLSFHQDLIVSKIISSESIQRKIDQPESMPQNMHMAGEQLVLTNEIRHSVITSETLDIIDKMATNQEKKELYEKLHVIHCSFHPKHLKCNSIEEWIYKIQEFKLSKGNEPRWKSKKFFEILSHSKNNHNLPHYWVAVPMENFIGKLVNKRASLKKLFKETNESKYDALNNHLKLIINTCYGILASRYFPISNLILANVITNTARCQCWLFSKSFNSKNIIVDGCLYTPHKVLNIKSFKKNPGFNTLYNIHTANKKQIFKHFESLGDHFGHSINWNDLIDNLSKNPDANSVNSFIKLADDLRNVHFKDFCNHFNLESKFNIEHDPKNIAICTVTMGRGHYLMKNYKGNIESKIRGTQNPEKEESIESPVYKFMLSRMYELPNESPTFELNNICYSNRTMIKADNRNSIQRKLGHLYKKNDLSLHSNYIGKKTFTLNLDTGKFDSFETFKNFKSSYAKFLGLSYLNDKCFTIVNSNKCVINKQNLWNLFNKNKEMLRNCDTLKRMSKKDKSIMISWLQKAKDIDPYVEIPNENHSFDELNFEDNTN